MALASHNWQLNEQVCLPKGLAAVRGGVFILYHPVTPSLEVALREAKAYLEMRRHFESMAVLIWLGQPFPPPPAEVRAAFGAAFTAGPKVTAVAWVVDSEHSLGASVVHSVSMQMFTGTSQVRLFRDPFEAASWISSIEGTEAELILDGLDTLDRAQPEP
ncbi:hypothetical protein [Enhygromyxa salina]|uniref:hypothetical protein n=1 Tax=Enhygromyxa salina TaxID=215803 RepID=UPI0004E6774E|nr:hypothetical protein [Enhygromyxa salina]